MEVQLDDLLGRIKKEGIDAADKEAAGIIEAAKKKAERIVQEAQDHREKQEAEAKQATARFEESAKAAIAQAGRDLIISLQKQIDSSLNELVQDVVKESYNEKVIAEAITTVVKSWSSTDVDVAVPEALQSKVLSSVKGALGDALKKGLEIKASTSVDSGFVLQEKDGSAFYDFTAEGIAQALKSYVSPNIAALLQQK